MSKVKGSAIIPWVKSIRGNKSGAWDKCFSDEDIKMIFGHILESSWYPYETYIKCVNAVSKIVAKDNMKTIRQWGRDWAYTGNDGVYKNVYIKARPRRALKYRQLLVSQIFDFITTDLEEISESEYIMKIEGPGPEFKPAFYVVLGSMEKGLEINGAKGLKAEFIEKSWEGAPATRIRFSWTGWG